MGGYAATQSFARLFMIPGMDHCAGGEGAGAIDYMAAITDWVEMDKAPAFLHGVHPLPGAPLDYFGVTLPRLNHKWYGFERDHYAWPGPSKAVGTPAATLAQRPLAEALLTAVIQADHYGTAAMYPRRSILNAIEKAMWETFYQTDADDSAQQAAIAALDQTGLHR